MDYLSYKLKLIYSRYLIIAIGSIVGFSLLNICFFQTQLIPIEDFFYEFLIPMLLPILPLIFWLRPRLKLLRLERKNGKDLFDFYLMAAWFAIICPSIFAQKYITSAVGQLTTLKTISSIDQRHLTKFYKVHKLYLDKKHCAVQVEAKVTGKHNENLNFTVYAAIPIYNEATPPLWGSSSITRSPQDKVKSSNTTHLDYIRPKVWLGWQKTKRISNKLTKEAKDSIYRIFIEDSYQSFLREKIYDFDYIQKIGISQDYKNFKKGIARADPGSPANPILLIPKYTPFEKKGSHQLFLTLLSFFIGSTIWLIMLILPRLKKNKLPTSIGII
ncbi:hypothetical protein H9N25_18005 [Pedobacter riviphilus]|uniref:ResB-like domain-containing protein n=1 Tax=Pedobacter riviphilus TaxID=2766984 RepID=A0ABX6TGP3_9SPHI|nr:hypothetical protein [Pedobacter riviphilus]QNR83817.1 hypothetical protein H9N25_18005 [Pedobacter riviphilus]